jgi:hypothetical protein
MTRQTKRFVELSDIVALHFECKHCKTTLALPVSRRKVGNSLKACPSCGRGWAVLNETSYELVFDRFLEELTKLTAVLKGDPPQIPAAPVGFSFSLEIKEEALTELRLKE